MRKLIKRVIKLFTDRRTWVRLILVSAIASGVAWQVGDLLIKDGGVVAAIICALSIRISLYKSVREGFGQIVGTALGAGVALACVSLFNFGIVSVALTVLFCSVGVAAGFDQEEAGHWLAKARLLVEEIPGVRAQALEARGHAKWFPTAEVDEAEELYVRGVAVEHTVVQVRTIARTLFDSSVKGGIAEETKRDIAQALSAASFAVSSKAEQIKTAQGIADSRSATQDARIAGAALADSLMEASDDVDQEQLVRGISLVSNIGIIADSLDESSPALHDVLTPGEPAMNQVLKVSPIEQGARFGSRIAMPFTWLKRRFRKYF